MMHGISSEEQPAVVAMLRTLATASGLVVESYSTEWQLRMLSPISNSNPTRSKQLRMQQTTACRIRILQTMRQALWNGHAAHRAVIAGCNWCALACMRHAA